MKSDKERQISQYHVYVESQKKKKKRYKLAHLENRNRVTNAENKLIVTKREIGGRQIGILGLTYTYYCI